MFNGLNYNLAPLRAAPALLLLGDSGLGDKEEGEDAEEEEEMLLLLPGTSPIRAALAGRARSQQVRYTKSYKKRIHIRLTEPIAFSFLFFLYSRNNTQTRNEARRFAQNAFLQANCKVDDVKNKIVLLKL